MTDQQGWKPITVDRATVIDLDELRWSLSAAPDYDWIAEFRRAAVSKSGSMAYVMSVQEPNVMGSSIQWRVPQGDHLDANNYVRARVTAANGAYGDVLRRRAEESDQAAEEKRTHDEAVKEAQRLLDEASNPPDPDSQT